MMIYHMLYPTIEGSSTSNCQAAHYQILLKEITASDLLSARLAGTHKIMMSMCCAGKIPLFEIDIKQWLNNKKRVNKKPQPVLNDE